VKSVVYLQGRDLIVSKAEFGTKRICGSCGAKFYDLLNSPIICPKCATVFVPPEPPPVRVRRTMQDVRPRGTIPAAPPPVADIENVDEGIQEENGCEIAVIEPDDSAEQDDDGVRRDISREEG
jgi:uncharacterized protein (TIGR02300 family)